MLNPPHVYEIVMAAHPFTMRTICRAPVVPIGNLVLPGVSPGLARRVQTVQTVQSQSSALPAFFIQRSEAAAAPGRHSSIVFLLSHGSDVFDWNCSSDLLLSL